MASLHHFLCCYSQDSTLLQLHNPTFYQHQGHLLSQHSFQKCGIASAKNFQILWWLFFLHWFQHPLQLPSQKLWPKIQHTHQPLQKIHSFLLQVLESSELLSGLCQYILIHRLVLTVWNVFCIFVYCICNKWSQFWWQVHSLHINFQMHKFSYHKHYRRQYHIST